MLEFNPHFRPSAKQLLKNKIFDSIRHENDIKSAISPYRIKIKIDQNEDAIDYENTNIRKDLKKKLLYTIVRESKKLKSST